MFAKFFKAPSLTSTFSDDFLLATDRIVSYEYTKRWTKSGDFTIVLPFSKELLQALKLNGTIYFDNDWLWIQNIAYNGNQITVSGKDCKAFLETRIALPNDTGYVGYDSISGSTAVCIKNYLDHNLISPTNSSRQLPLSWDNDSVVGLLSDSYMARFEYISDIVTTLCENADIGFDIGGNIIAGGFLFKLLKGTDRSFSQSTNSRVILSARWGNVVSQRFEHGVDNLLNAVYATDPNGYSALVTTSTGGISRRECNVSVSVSNTDTWFERYALNEVKENIETDSFEIAVPFSGYGTDYTLGDTVTVKDDFTGERYDRIITEVTKSYFYSQRSISLVLGVPKQKPVQKIVNNMLNGTIRKG